ncbi:hypothetical protein K7432_010002 [Basidiobolus ranarum]|uniref:Uncharacterized protein n=1 Tax=Basidiobolus ranarum TaxID=34480 RepID=A0ABR2VWB1_9FUNG
MLSVVVLGKKQKHQHTSTTVTSLNPSSTMTLSGPTTTSGSSVAADSVTPTNINLKPEATALPNVTAAEVSGSYALQPPSITYFAGLVVSLLLACEIVL